MDNSPTPPTEDPETSPKRLLDPFEEWRDHANHWDVSALLRKRPEEETAANADKEPAA